MDRNKFYARLIAVLLAMLFVAAWTHGSPALCSNQLDFSDSCNSQYLYVGGMP